MTEKQLKSKMAQVAALRAKVPAEVFTKAMLAVQDVAIACSMEDAFSELCELLEIDEVQLMIARGKI